MKYFLSALLIAATVSASSQQVFHDADAQIRKVGSFSKVEVSSAIDLQLSTGSEDAVAVSADGQEQQDAVKMEVVNGVLKIWYENKKWFKNRNNHIRVYVAARSLEGIGGSGASEITVNGVLNSRSLAIRLSGASDLKGEVKAGSLQIDLSGASDIVLKGSATDLKVETSGASHLKAFDFVADNCLVDASGASDVKITANKLISVEASGASNVSYKGAGQEGKVRSSGASSISRKG